MDGPVDQERLDFARGFMCASNPGPAPPKPPTAEAYPAERITLAWLAGHAAGMERRRKRRQPPAGTSAPWSTGGSRRRPGRRSPPGWERRG